MTHLNNRIQSRWKTCNCVKKPDALDNYVIQCTKSCASANCPSTSATPPRGNAAEDTGGACHSTPKSTTFSSDFEKWLQRDTRQHELHFQSQTTPFHFHDCDTSLDSTVSLKEHNPLHGTALSTGETTFDCSGDIFDQMKRYIDD